MQIYSKEAEGIFADHKKVIEINSCKNPQMKCNYCGEEFQFNDPYVNEDVSDRHDFVSVQFHYDCYQKKLKELLTIFEKKNQFGWIKAYMKRKGEL